MVGSEGTLGVITQLTLRLSGIPEAISGGTCPFPSVEACCNTTIHTIQSGIPVARIELLDALQVRACNMHSKLGLPETPMLFLEFHGTEASVAEQSERFGEIAAEFGGGPFTWTTRPEERTRLWEARHHAALSNFALRPGACPPMFVCRYRGWPNVSPRPSAILSKAAFWHRSSATLAMVISISRC
jgi:D-lactate dehydrogenase (cytochrome)